MKATSTSRAEQIRNGDFSSGGQNWQAYNDVNFDDQRCNIGPNGIAAQPLPSVPAGRYRLSARAAVVASGSPTARLRLMVGANNSIIDIFSSTPDTYYADIDIPANAGRIELHLEAREASVWFDDVSLNLAPSSDELLQNGDFSAGNAHWELTGVDFAGGTCALRLDDVAQTVAVPTIGYYQLTARARAGAGSMGRLQVKLLPDGESFYKTVSSPEWSDYVIDVAALMGESAFKVSLARVTGDDVEFDDISLRLTSGKKS